MLTKIINNDALLGLCVAAVFVLLPLIICKLIDAWREIRRAEGWEE